MKNWLTILSFISSLGLGLLVWFFFSEGSFNLLKSLEQREIFIVGNLNRELYSIGIGLIPLVAYFCTFQTKNKSLFNFLLQILNVILGALFIFILALGIANLGGENPDVLFPEHFVYEPFSGFWNFTLLPALLFYACSLVLWNKFKNSLRK